MNIDNWPISNPLMAFQLNNYSILMSPDHITAGAYNWNLWKSLSGWRVIGLATRDYCECSYVLWAWAFIYSKIYARDQGTPPAKPRAWLLHGRSKAKNLRGAH